VGSSALIVVGITIVLFRLLDIYKPWPISAAERIQPTGAGIMADDLVAGFAAGMIVSLLVVIS
jgi:phosphatidylglycerophosphatase A